jgi:hypothetical protein
MKPITLSAASSIAASRDLEGPTGRRLEISSRGRHYVSAVSLTKGGVGPSLAARRRFILKREAILCRLQTVCTRARNYLVTGQPAFSPPHGPLGSGEVLHLALVEHATLAGWPAPNVSKGIVSTKVDNKATLMDRGFIYGPLFKTLSCSPAGNFMTVT